MFAILGIAFLVLEFDDQRALFVIELMFAVNASDLIQLVKIDPLKCCHVLLQLHICTHLSINLTVEHVPLLIIPHNSVICEHRLLPTDFYPMIFQFCQY